MYCGFAKIDENYKSRVKNKKAHQKFLFMKHTFFGKSRENFNIFLGCVICFLKKGFRPGIKEPLHATNSDQPQLKRKDEAQPRTLGKRSNSSRNAPRNWKPVRDETLISRDRSKLRNAFNLTRGGPNQDTKSATVEDQQISNNN